jgi:hypothetical protein
MSKSDSDKVIIVKVKRASSTRGLRRQGSLYAEIPSKGLTQPEAQQMIQRGLRRVAATRRKSRRTLEEIARLREENREVLEKL